jgi:phosphoglycerate dehydrogenase-like enzyme
MGVVKMEKVYVLIGMPLDEEDLAKIGAVDPRVEVQYAVEELGTEVGRDPFSLFPLDNPISQRELTPEEAGAALDGMLVDTEVIFSWTVPLNVSARAPRLKWVQGTGAGIDMLVGNTDLLESDVMITNAAGVRTISVAEFTLCFMLMLAKNAPRFVMNKEKHSWDGYFTLDLHGRTLGIIGLGRIGREVAKRANAFAVKVLAMDTFVTRRKKHAFGVDEAFPPEEFLDMLPQCDFVVLAAPLTPETRGLIGEAELRAMKPTSYIINVARGPIMQEQVLIRALKEKWIAGAGLDVFEKEPLPPDSELWDMPNVIISAHLAGRRERITHVLTDLFCENLKRYLSGREMINLVDKQRGF